MMLAGIEIPADVEASQRDLPGYGLQWQLVRQFPGTMLAVEDGRVFPFRCGASVPVKSPTLMNVLRALYALVPRPYYAKHAPGWTVREKHRFGQNAKAERKAAWGRMHDALAETPDEPVVVEVRRA